MEENVFQNIISENRKKVTVTGVADMLKFTDDEVVLLTKLGTLTIKGSNLKAGAFNTDGGDMQISGNVYAFVYTDDTSAKEGFFKRLLK